MSTSTTVPIFILPLYSEIHTFNKFYITLLLLFTLHTLEYVTEYAKSRSIYPRAEQFYATKIAHYLGSSAELARDPGVSFCPLEQQR